MPLVNKNIPIEVRNHIREACRSINVDQVFDPAQMYRFFALDLTGQGRAPQQTTCHGFEHHAMVAEWNRHGFEVYYVVNELSPFAKTWTNDDIVRVRSVWVDWDTPEKPLPQWPLEPTYKLETSPKRYQLRWDVDGLSFNEFHAIMVEMVRLGSDKKARKLAQLLRVPGSLNHKEEYAVQFGGPFQTQVEGSGRRYTRDEILKAFLPNGLPPARAAVPAVHPAACEGVASEEFPLADLPRAVSALAALGLGDTEIYRMAGMAFCEGFGGSEEAYEAFDVVCREFERHDEKGNRRDWINWAKSKRRGLRRSLGTLYWLARQVGWSPPEGNNDNARLDAPFFVDLDALLGNRQAPIVQKAMGYIRDRFASRGHNPSAAFLRALEEVCMVLDAMRTGVAPKGLYLSSLDPGVGKSTAIILYIKAALEDDPFASFHIFADRHEELERFNNDLTEAGVPLDRIAFLTGKETNDADYARAAEAQVLLSTKKKLEAAHMRGSLDYKDIAIFHYRGQPRKVICWDESHNPVEAATLSEPGLMSFMEPLSKGRFKAFYKPLREFLREIDRLENGHVTEFPELAGGRSREDFMDAFPEAHKVQAALIHSLMGAQVRVSKDGGDTAYITYTQTLPADMTKLVTDASGRFLATYHLIDGLNEQKVYHLASPRKDYSPLTIHHSKRAVGRDARNDENSAKPIADEVASTINRKVPKGEPLLIVLHKRKDGQEHLPDIRKWIEERLNEGHNVEFTHWGAHTATNKFHNCKYVFLVGLHVVPNSFYRALTLGLLGLPLEAEVPFACEKSVRYGELKHHLYQAACRGSVRKLEGDQCPPNVHLFAMFSGKTLSADELAEVFPGAKVVPWGSKLTDKENQAYEAISEYVRTWNGPIQMTLTTRQLAELIGCGTNNLKRVLSDPVTQALSADGIQIDRPGHGKFSIRLGHPVNR